jgi:hypothetical protein
MSRLRNRRNVIKMRPTEGAVLPFADSVKVRQWKHLFDTYVLRSTKEKT